MPILASRNLASADWHFLPWLTLGENDVFGGSEYLDMRTEYQRETSRFKFAKSWLPYVHSRSEYALR